MSLPRFFFFSIFLGFYFIRVLCRLLFLSSSSLWAFWCTSLFIIQIFSVIYRTYSRFCCLIRIACLASRSCFCISTLFFLSPFGWLVIVFFTPFDPPLVFSSITALGFHFVLAFFLPCYVAIRHCHCQHSSHSSHCSRFVLTIIYTQLSRVDGLDINATVHCMIS